MLRDFFPIGMSLAFYMDRPKNKTQTEGNLES
ncbi:hypothetical protein DSM3645_04560 [Blastopirellula marina DSM 3645]|uniref:Uncharacterized protein n=1 Tax=Blastopirellula marina DSM 3645 TaxID=314230 RepID=A4A1F8_9BACT|nr:hypothetical protein DSM3645_04560 [Blastopirellula marina DSM 3645]